MYPQVLLLGNGINRTFDADGWKKMIEKLHCNPKIDSDAIKTIAFPLQVVLATGDKMDDSPVSAANHI